MKDDRIAEFLAAKARLDQAVRECKASSDKRCERCIGQIRRYCMRETGENQKIDSYMRAKKPVEYHAEYGSGKYLIIGHKWSIGGHELRDKSEPYPVLELMSLNGSRSQMVVDPAAVEFI